VGVLNDDMSELDEELTVSITGNDQGALVAGAAGTTTIISDDFAPEAVDDVFSVGEESDLVGNVFNANPDDPDSDADSDTLTLISAEDSDGNPLAIDGTNVTLASGAILSLNPDGSFAFDPNSSASDFNDLAAGEPQAKWVRKPSPTPSAMAIVAKTRRL